MEYLKCLNAIKNNKNCANFAEFSRFVLDVFFWFVQRCRWCFYVFSEDNKWLNISSLNEVPPGSKKVSSMQRKLMHAQVQSLYYTGFLSIFFLTELEGIWQDASCNLGAKSTTTPILAKTHGNILANRKWNTIYFKDLG